MVPVASLFICFFLIIGIAGGEIFAMEQRMVGGPCEYNEYKGNATIVSVKKGGDGGEERYDVKFVFRTDMKVPDRLAPEPKDTHELRMTNSMRPTRAFLERYGIREGRDLPCTLNIIRKGTCTPVLFEFPTIDRTDYR